MHTIAEPKPFGKSGYIGRLKASATPYLIGVIDGERGFDFAPERYFSFGPDLLAYTAGFEEIRGELPITRAYKAQWDSPVEEYAIEDDHDWIRSGCANGLF